MSEDHKYQEKDGNAFEYEVVEGLSPESIQEITRFLQKEKAILTSLPAEERTPDKDLFKYVFRLITAGSEILKKIQDRADLQKSFAVFAKSQNDIVGVFVAGVSSENTVPGDVFFGTAFTQAKKGIATELVRQAHEVLRQKGIKEYKVSVWDASKSAIQKALGREITPNFSDRDGKEHTIKLG
jgi:hypothetical protein